MSDFYYFARTPSVFCHQLTRNHKQLSGEESCWKNCFARKWKIITCIFYTIQPEVQVFLGRRAPYVFNRYLGFAKHTAVEGWDQW